MEREENSVKIASELQVKCPRTEGLKSVIDKYSILCCLILPLLLKIACVAVIVAAVSAYPGAESYANQNIYGSNHDGGYEDHHEHYVSCCT